MPEPTPKVADPSHTKQTPVASSTVRYQGISKLYPVSEDMPQGAWEDAVMLVEGTQIKWAGPREQAPPLGPEEQVVDLKGAMVTPGWIDAHTHLIWAGSRQNEFRARMEGKGYLDIAKAGGGIMSSVRAVREASLEELVALARPRVARFLSFGVTTLEVKSGYGLQTKAECRMLEAAGVLAQEGPLEIVRTFLGAHTVPTEYKERRDAYVELVCKEMIPLVAGRGLASACDVFVEESAFSLEEARQVLQTGLDHGLLPRVHADQLSAGGGAALAAELGALSADHLEEIDDRSIKKMSQAGTVACLIPGSTFCLRQKKYAPARKLLEAGVTLALSTDLNPGTTCSENLSLIGTMACIHMHMTPDEVLHALTRGPAHSIQRQHDLGSLAPGYQADFVAFNAPDVDYLFYHYGVSHVREVFKRGQSIWSVPS